MGKESWKEQRKTTEKREGGKRQERNRENKSESWNGTRK